MQTIQIKKKLTHQRHQLLIKYTVYSKKNCSYCVRAIALLEAKNMSYVVKKIDEEIEFFKEMQQNAPSMKTLPVIFKNEELIGGYHELYESLQINE